MKCPNKNSKEWKDLVAQYGEARALTLYGIEDDIPTLQRAEEINNEYGLVSIQSDRNTKDLEIRNKYFNKNTVKSSEVLKKISESNHPLNKVAEHLLPLVKKNDVDITLLNNEEFNEALDTNVISNVNVAGLFQLESNQILIVENSNFRGKGSEPTLLHEILHSLSHNELRNNTEAKKKFDEFYNYLKPKFELYSENTPIGYAFKDTDELLVALFTNADLINELVKIPSRSDKFDNIFSELFDYILGLFKIKKGSSIYNEAFSLATDVLNEQRELLAYAESKLEEVQINNVIKPGVQELFESNHELANAVYEALGFKNEDSISKDLRFEYVDSTTTHDYFKVFYKEQDLTVDSKISDVTVGITLSIHNQGYIDAIEIPKGLRNKGLGKSIYRKVNSELLQGNLKSDSLGRISEDAKRVWESLVKSGEAVKTSDGYSFTQSQISPQQKQQAQQLYSQYLDTIFPDSKVTEIDNSLYTSVINQLVQENKLEKDCTGGSKLKAEDGIATLFEKGGKWEIVTDFKNAPTHKSGGKDIYIQGKKVEVEKNELRIENDFGDVAVIPSKYRVEVEDAIKFNCYSCIDGIVEELPKMKDYAGDGTVFPFFGRYKRFKNSLPNNLKNTPEYDYAMRYYWKHNNKPKSFDESINRERPMFTMEDDGYYHAPSVEPNTLRFLKPKNHPTLQYELDWYNSDNPDAVDFRSKYNLDTSDKFYKYVPKKK